MHVGVTLPILYVDYMITNEDDFSGIFELKRSLSHHFEMKDLGHLNYFLGFKVLYDSAGYYLSQSNYTSNILTPLDGTPLSDATLF